MKTAIVTGASKGIGAAVAKALSRQGVNIVVNYANARDAAEQVADEIRASGGTAIIARADVADRHGLTFLFDKAEREFGQVDILVNNAGLLRQAPIAEVDDSLFDVLVATNLGGVFRGMREGARRLNDGGRIITISSSVIGFYHPNFGVYAATKAAVDAMTHILAKELGERGITVNAVSPGQVVTELFLEGKSEEELRLYASRIPLGRLGVPDDIAGIVAFLASAEGGWVNGQVIRANGGGV